MLRESLSGLSAKSAFVMYHLSMLQQKGLCCVTLDCQRTEQNAVTITASNAFELDSAETPAVLVVEMLPKGHSPCKSASLVVSAGCLLSTASAGRCWHDKRAGRTGMLAVSRPCRVASMASSVVALGP